mgnify:CR=1 FL=1
MQKVQSADKINKFKSLEGGGRRKHAAKKRYL